MRTMKNKFKTLQGRLTPYALACGYVETYENAGHSLTMWQDGGCKCVHVRQHDHGTATRAGAGRVFWDSFTTLTQARKRFDAAKRVLTRNGNA